MHLYLPRFFSDWGERFLCVFWSYCEQAGALLTMSLRVNAPNNFQVKILFSGKSEFHACFSGINPHSTFGAKLPFQHSETKQRHLDLFSYKSTDRFFHSTWEGGGGAPKILKNEQKYTETKSCLTQTFNTVNSLRQRVQKSQLWLRIWFPAPAPFWIIACVDVAP